MKTSKVIFVLLLALSQSLRISAQRDHYTGIAIGATLGSVIGKSVDTVTKTLGYNIALSMRDRISKSVWGKTEFSANYRAFNSGEGSEIEHFKCWYGRFSFGSDFILGQNDEPLLLSCGGYFGPAFGIRESANNRLVTSNFDLGLYAAVGTHIGLVEVEFRYEQGVYNQRKTKPRVFQSALAFNVRHFF